METKTIPEPPRLDYPVSPGAHQAMMDLEKYVRSTDLGHTLLGLIKTRASQINGCAFCIDMHTQEARSHGESEERLYALSAWRESPLFTDHERAALAWTEAITNIRDGRASKEVYEQVRAHFTEEELSDLTVAIVTINGWNRITLGFRLTPGSFNAEAA